MNHSTSADFWAHFEELPLAVQRLARTNFKRLQTDPRHPSLHFKKVGEQWSVRIGRNHRALGNPVAGGILWFWIGTHADYDAILRS